MIGTLSRARVTALANVSSVLVAAGHQIRKLPVIKISRIADLLRTAIFSIDGIREERGTAGVVHKRALFD